MVVENAELKLFLVYLFLSRGLNFVASICQKVDYLLVSLLQGSDVERNLDMEDFQINWHKSEVLKVDFTFSGMTFDNGEND